MVTHTTGGGLEGALNDMRSHTNQRKLLSVAFANGQNMCTVKQYMREAAQMVCMARSVMHSKGVLPIWSACWDRIPAQTEMGRRDYVEERNSADLEFAALDKLEGEDCGSLLSQGMTHGRHAAWSDASHILQTDNPFQDNMPMNHCLHCCVSPAVAVCYTQTMEKK